LLLLLYHSMWYPSVCTRFSTEQEERIVAIATRMRRIFFIELCFKEAIINKRFVIQPNAGNFI
jgi:hypothetical protein